MFARYYSKAPNPPSQPSDGYVKAEIQVIFRQKSKDIFMVILTIWEYRRKMSLIFEMTKEILFFFYCMPLPRKIDAIFSFLKNFSKFEKFVRSAYTRSNVFLTGRLRWQYQISLRWVWAHRHTRDLWRHHGHPPRAMEITSRLCPRLNLVPFIMKCLLPTIIIPNR